MVVTTNFDVEPGMPLVLGNTISLATMDNPEVAVLAVTGGQRIETIRQGPLEITDWTSLTGAANLEVGSLYYLGVTTPLTAIPPIEGFLVEIGRAFAPTILDVNIKTPIFF